MEHPKLGEAGNQAPAPGWLAKGLALTVGAVVLILAFTLSMIFLAVAFVVGLLIVARIWWKTRDLRKQMRERGAPMPPASGGRVIEGEVVRQPEER